MDGARYHKRRVEITPTSSFKKQEIIDWLNDHNIEASNELRKAELIKLVQNYKEKISFVCVEIAKRFNHQILFTHHIIVNFSQSKVYGQLLKVKWQEQVRIQVL